MSVAAPRYLTMAPVPTQAPEFCSDPGPSEATAHRMQDTLTPLIYGGSISRPPVGAWNRRQYLTLYTYYGFSYACTPTIKFNL